MKEGRSLDEGTVHPGALAGDRLRDPERVIRDNLHVLLKRLRSPFAGQNGNDLLPRHISPPLAPPGQRLTSQPRP